MYSGSGSEEKLMQAVMPGNCSGCVDWKKKLHSLRSEVLIESAEAGHVDCVVTLVAEGADVNATNRKRETAVMLATKHGHWRCVDVLVKAGADVNAFDDEYNSAVVYAAKNGHNKCMELLIGAGVNVNCSQPQPLRWAVEAEHLKCAELLIQAGADVNREDNYYPWNTTPLICAAAKGLENFVRFLIEAGADVNKEAGRMIVVRAIKYSDKRCVKLADLPGRIGGCRSPSDPPLVHAVRNGQAKCLDILLQSGADVNRPGSDVNEDSYLDRALLHAGTNGSEECVTLLLKAGANVNTQAEDGCTALMAASQCGHNHCVNLLIQSGADVNKSLSDDYLSYTALMFAVVYCRKRCANKLIQAGADVNKVNSQGYSILMTAANSKQSSNCDEKYHGAIKRFDMRCMKILLRSGATVNNLPRAGFNVSNVPETGTTVNNVPRVRFSVNNMPGRGATVNNMPRTRANMNNVPQTGATVNNVQRARFSASNVPRTGATVNNVPETGATVSNVPETGATVSNVPETGATVSNVPRTGTNVPRVGANANNLLGNNKAEVTVTKKLPVEVLVLLFVAGEIFTQKQLKETVQEGIFTKPGSGDDSGSKREDHGDVVRDLDHVAWEDWVESSRTAVLPPESFWKVSLKRQCRLAVREHLLKLDMNGNLFHRIPLLGLPQMLTQYLLYNVSLDDNDGDDNASSL